MTMTPSETVEAMIRAAEEREAPILAAIEQRAATDGAFAVAYALLKLTDAVSDCASKIEDIALALPDPEAAS
jgi:hypothetical protein